MNVLFLSHPACLQQKCVEVKKVAKRNTRGRGSGSSEVVCVKEKARPVLNEMPCPRKCVKECCAKACLKPATPGSGTKSEGGREKVEKLESVLKERNVKRTSRRTRKERHGSVRVGGESSVSQATKFEMI